MSKWAPEAVSLVDLVGEFGFGMRITVDISLEAARRYRKIGQGYRGRASAKRRFFCECIGFYLVMFYGWSGWSLVAFEAIWMMEVCTLYCSFSFTISNQSADAALITPYLWRDLRTMRFETG